MLVSALQAAPPRCPSCGVIWPDAVKWGILDCMRYDKRIDGMGTDECQERMKITRWSRSSRGRVFVRVCCSIACLLVPFLAKACADRGHAPPSTRRIHDNETAPSHHNHGLEISVPRKRQSKCAISGPSLWQMYLALIPILCIL